jgi:hypothetical protein
MNQLDFAEEMRGAEDALEALGECLDSAQYKLGGLVSDLMKRGAFGDASPLVERGKLLTELQASLERVGEQILFQLEVPPASLSLGHTEPMRAVPPTPAYHEAPNEAGAIRLDGRKRQPTEGIRVRFPDGTVFQDKNAARTMALVCQKLGFEKVQGLGETIAGVPLVSRERHPKMSTSEPRFHFHELNGWYACVIT